MGHRRLARRRRLGLHAYRARPRHRRSGCHRLGRNRRLLDRALAGHAGRRVDAVRGLRAVPLLRCRQARPIGWTDRRFKRARAGCRAWASSPTIWWRRCARCSSSRCGAFSLHDPLARRRSGRAMGRAIGRCAARTRLAPGHRRELHRRPDRSHLHRARRLFRLVRARLRHLQQRRQDRAARRRRDADRAARRGQRSGGARHGRRRVAAQRRPTSPWPSPASPAPVRLGRQAVGLVWLAWVQRGAAVHAERLQLGGDRAAIREQTVAAALSRALQLATA